MLVSQWTRPIEQDVGPGCDHAALYWGERWQIVDGGCFVGGYPWALGRRFALVEQIGRRLHLGCSGKCSTSSDRISSATLGPTHCALDLHTSVEALGYVDRESLDRFWFVVRGAVLDPGICFWRGAPGRGSGTYFHALAHCVRSIVSEVSESISAAAGPRGSRSKTLSPAATASAKTTRCVTAACRVCSL